MKRLLPLLLLLSPAFAAAPATDWAPNLTGSAIWQGNVSNGGAVWDRISTLQLSLDGLSSRRYELSRHDALHLTGRLAGDWFPRYRDFSRGTVGARVDWEHTLGTDAFAPVFTLEGAADLTRFVESDRSGTTVAATLKLEKRFHSGWRAAVRQRFEQARAKESVFDSSSHETALDLGRDINVSTRLLLTARWRQGDVITHAQYNRPDLAAIAHTSKAVSTFRMPMTAFAADARTVGARLAFIHATADDVALILAYEYAQTKRGAVQFENQTISLSRVRQF